MFTDEQIAQLGRALDGARVKQRAQGGRPVQYVETYDCIDAANRIFRFDGWSSRVMSIEHKRHGDALWYEATVEVQAGGVTRVDVGDCDVAYNRSKGVESASADAFSTARKGAVSDALKRALRTFGAQFGLMLADKEDHTRDGEEPAPMTPKRTQATASAPAQNGPKPDGTWSDGESPAADPKDAKGWLSNVLAALAPRGYDRDAGIVWAKAWMQKELGVEQSTLMTVAQWRQLRAAALKLPPAAAKAS